MNNHRQGFLECSPKLENRSQGQQIACSRSWWHSPLVGYPLAVVFVAGAFLIPLAERFLGIQDFFIEPPFVIAMILVGWLWGIGPALLALLLEIFALDYWIVPPLGNISFFLWPDIASFAPFILIQLIVLGLIVAQKNYRQQLLLAHQEVATYAEELAESNRELAASNQQLAGSNQALERSNAQLDEASHIKDLFLSLASHELKTPLTTIQGQAQLALRRLARQSRSLPAEFAFLPAHLDKIEGQASRLYVLINDLLNLSSLRSGKMPLRIVPCDLCDICRETAEDQRDLTDHSIELKLPPYPVILQADKERICQVVLNLLMNAIKYSPPHSPVKVEIALRDALSVLTIHNAGPAIPRERQNHLFEPFYRTPETQLSTIQGWGLGLAISKEIVEQHSGRIWVLSEESDGTTFGIELPLQPVFRQESHEVH